MSIGEKIIGLIEDHDITRKKLARDVGVSYDTLTRYVRGEGDIKASILHDIAVYFDVSMDYFWE